MAPVPLVSVPLGKEWSHFDVKRRHGLRLPPAYPGAARPPGPSLAGVGVGRRAAVVEWGWRR